jgi:hypothetical protein
LVDQALILDGAINRRTAPAAGAFLCNADALLANLAGCTCPGRTVSQVADPRNAGLTRRTDDVYAQSVDALILVAQLVGSAGNGAVRGVTVEIGATDFSWGTLHVGAVNRDALTIDADLRVTALVPGLGAIRRETLAIGTLLPGRAGHTDTVAPDTPALIADFVRVADLLPAILGKALPPGTALAGRAGDPHTVRMYAFFLVADLAEIRTLLGGAVQRVAPAVGAPKPRFALDPHAGAPLAYSVDAHLPLPEASNVGAVGRIAVSAGAVLPWRAGDPRATSLHALFVDAHLSVAGALLSLAVDGIAPPHGAALSLRAFHTYAGGVLTLLVDAHLSQARTIPPDAVLGVALPTRTVHSLFTLHPQAGQVHTAIPGADKSRWTIVGGAVIRPAESLDQHPVGAVPTDGSPGASHQQQVRQTEESCREKLHEEPPRVPATT